MIDAVIFDMDGLLIDSEPLWHRAEIRAFGEVGLALGVPECLQTTGLRIDEVVAHWYQRRPWSGASPAAVAQRIVDVIAELVAAEGVAKAGVAHALDFVAQQGVRVAVASSSPHAVIRAAVARLGLGDRFELLCSAQDEPFGKPHPGVYITTAQRLGVAPARCLALEDSLNGVLAAKAARMACVAVPEGPARDDPRFAIADVVLASLAEFDARAWATATRARA